MVGLAGITLFTTIPYAAMCTSPHLTHKWFTRKVLWQQNNDHCNGKWQREVCVLGVGDLNRVLSETGWFTSKVLF